MAFPTLSTLQVDSASTRRPDMAEAWAALAERNDHLAEHRGQGCGYHRGAALSGWSLVNAGTYELALARIPSAGTSTGMATVYVYLSAYSSGDVTYYAQPVHFVNGTGFEEPTRGPITTIGAPNAAGWYSADVYIGDSSPSEGFNGLRVFAVAAAATGQTVETICVLANAEATMADGDTPPAAWPALRLDYVATPDRPDSAAIRRRIKQQQDFVAATYPRTLFCHANVVPRATRTSGTVSDAEGVTLRYKVARGVNAGDCALRVYCQQDANSVSAGNGKIEVYVDDDTSAGSPAVSANISDTLTTTDAGWISLTVPAASWTAESVSDFKVRVYGGQSGGTNGAVVVHALVLDEGAFDAAVYVASGETATPSTDYVVGPQRPHQGHPIVADYTGGTFTRGIDHAPVAKGAQLMGYRKRALLLEDHLWTNDSTSGVADYPATNHATASAATLWRTKRTPTYGTTALDLWVSTFRLGTTDPTASMYFFVAQDSTVLPGVLTSRGLSAFAAGNETAEQQLVPRWVYVGRIPVTANTLTEIELRAGWADSNGTSKGSVSDSVVVDGALLLEVPNRSA